MGQGEETSAQVGGRERHWCDDGLVVDHHGAEAAGDHDVDRVVGVVGDGEHGGVPRVAEQSQLHGDAPGGGQREGVLQVGGVEANGGALGEEEFGRRWRKQERGGENLDERGVEGEGGGGVEEGEELCEERRGTVGGEKERQQGDDHGVLGQEEEKRVQEGVVRHQRLHVPLVYRSGKRARRTLKELLEHLQPRVDGGGGQGGDDVEEGECEGHVRDEGFAGSAHFEQEATQRGLREGGGERRAGKEHVHREGEKEEEKRVVGLLGGLQRQQGLDMSANNHPHSPHGAVHGSTDGCDESRVVVEQREEREQEVLPQRQLLLVGRQRGPGGEEGEEEGRRLLDRQVRRAVHHLADDAHDARLRW